MAASPDESRTQALGHKRKRPNTTGEDGTSKVQRLEENDDYVSLGGDEEAQDRRLSKDSRESGEVSSNDPFANSNESRGALLENGPLDMHSKAESTSNVVERSSRSSSGSSGTALAQLQKDLPTVKKDVTPMSDDAAAPRNRRTMALTDIDELDLREYVRQKTKTPGMTVEIALKFCAGDGRPFSKKARKTLNTWRKTVPKPAPPSDESNPTTLSIKELEKLVSKPEHFQRDLLWKDVPGKNGFRNAMLAHHKDMDEGVTVLQAVMDKAKGGKFKGAARNCLKGYVRSAYLGEGGSRKRGNDGAASVPAPTPKLETEAAPKSESSKPKKKKETDDERWKRYKPLFVNPADYEREIDLEDLPTFDLCEFVQDRMEEAEIAEDQTKFRQLLVEIAEDSGNVYKSHARDFVYGWVDEQELVGRRRYEPDFGYDGARDDRDEPQQEEADMEIDSEDDSSSDSSDEDHDLDAPAKAASDYGAVARAAASALPQPRHTVTLAELSSDDQVLQHRYFRLSDPNDLVRCLSCGTEGHQASDCPSQVCKHCGSRAHFASACPKYIKCGRCRRRGHIARKCKATSTQPGLDDLCDVCGHAGHVEEECPRLWCTYTTEAEQVHKIGEREMIVDCYNCGSNSHWGDDCPEWRDAANRSIRANFGPNDTWSRKHAERYLLKLEMENGGYGGDGSLVERTNVYQGSSMQAYQLAQLGDY